MPSSTTPTNVSWKIWTTPDKVNLVTYVMQAFCNENGLDNSITIEGYDRECIMFALNHYQTEALPDVIYVDDEEISKYIAQHSDLLVTTENIINETNYVDHKRWNLYDDNLEMRGQPFSTNAVALYYRADLAEDFGFELENLTWDDFIEFGKNTLASENIKLIPKTQDLEKIIIKSLHNDYFDDDGNVTIDGACEVKSLIEKLTVNELLFLPDDNNFDQIMGALADGRVFAVIGGINWIDRINDMTTIDTQSWAVTNIPKSEVFTEEVDGGSYSFAYIQKEDFSTNEPLFALFAEKYELGLTNVSTYLLEQFRILPAQYACFDYIDYANVPLNYMSSSPYPFLTHLAEYIPFRRLTTENYE